jgi:hypothetical protein
MFFNYEEEEDEGGLDDLYKAFKRGKTAVTLKPYVKREPKKYELLSDAELTAGAGGYLIFDIECFPNYFCICFKDYKTKKVVIFERTEDGVDFSERKLAWIMANYTVIGFNIIKYDLLMLWYAHKGARNNHLKMLTNDIINGGMSPKQFEKQVGFKLPKTRHIDLIEVCPLEGSLKTYAARLHAERLQDLPFDPDERLEDWQQEVVLDYCVNDLDSTELLFENLFEQLKLRAELSAEYRDDLMSKSDAQIAEAVLAAEVARIIGRRPQRPEVQGGRVFNYRVPEWLRYQTPLMQKVLATVAAAGYEVRDNGTVAIPDSVSKLKINIGNSVYRMGNGGLHSSEKKTAHVTSDASDFVLIDRDVASYYPYIVLNSELYPEHLGRAFLTVYRTLVERRIAAKNAKNNAVADALKITINGAFGKLGSPYSVLYAPDLMIQVTITGQLALLMLIEAMEVCGIPVVSANTDGIVMKCPKHLEGKLLEVVKWWQGVTGFDTEETRYKAVYSRDVNAYIAIKEDDSCKGKNAFFDPWSGGKKAAIFRFHKNPTCTICIEAVNAYLTKGTPFKETIEGCRDLKKFVAVKKVKGGAHKDGEYLGKVVRWYYGQGERGAIHYVSNNNKVADSEGATPCMDIPNSLDFDWYIRKCHSMLFDLGHTKAPIEASLI